MIVNCDQDHRQGLKPRAVMTTNPEPDTGTPGVTVPTVLTVMDTPTKSTDTNTTGTSTKPVVDPSVPEVWYLKPITFAGRRTRIITQNFNGSVSITNRTAAVQTHVVECLISFAQAMLVHSNL
jgi:hypothetical protein